VLEGDHLQEGLELGGALRRVGRDHEATPRDPVVAHYDRLFTLGLGEPEVKDLIEYLKSL
jgi:hypothetical protein